MSITKVTEGGLDRNRIVTPLIINGDMSVAQRSTSATNVSSSGYHALDRFRFGFTDTDQLVATISQDTDVPSGQGFSKSMKFLVTTVESALDADDALQIQYRMEGQNLQHLKYGTSSAESLTLSFWVKSSVTGTYALAFKNSASGGTKLNVNTYAISSANTWEKKIINITGDTSSGIDNTNTNELELLWGLSAGSNYKGTSSSGWESYAAQKLFNGQTADIATTSSANFYLTGLQLEVGEFDSTTVPSFPFESYANNLSKCQRYLQKGYSAADNAVHAGRGQGTTAVDFGFSLVTPLRASPTITQSGSGWRVYKPSATLSDSSDTATVSTFYELNPYITLRSSGHSSITDNYLFGISPNGLTYFFDSEL
jgi:hypothetical protein